MSDMGFGYYGNPDGEGAPNVPASDQNAPKWFREKMEADAKAMREMRDELNALRQQSKQAEVAKVFQAQGYNPAAAALYTGEPEKAEEWLTANGGMLARLDGQAPTKETVPPGAPQTALTPESQQGMAAMNAAGTDGTAQTLTGDDAIAAALAATTSLEEFQQVARAHGWNYDMLS